MEGVTSDQGTTRTSAELERKLGIPNATSVLQVFQSECDIINTHCLHKVRQYKFES